MPARSRPLGLLLGLAALLALPAPATASPAPVSLELVGRTPALGEGGAEIAAYDPGSERAFVTNAETDALDVYDLARPAAPARTASIPLGGGPNSVAVNARGVVAVAVEADPATGPGRIAFLDADDLAIRGTAEVGALPDAVTFTPDGRTLLVANEGEPADGVDPDGSVSVVDVRAGGRRTRVRTATLAGVPTSGAVRSFTGSLARDAEPEYVAPAPDGETALVTLQEVNAIGVLDVRAARFTVVRGLGLKDHGRVALDPSDEDGIALGTFRNLFGLYQPDAIAAYSAGGRTYAVTANEGDARAEEDVRAGTLRLDPGAFPPERAAALARLRVSSLGGDTDGDGDYDRLYALGGRSLSVLDAGGRRVFDTGDELERRTAALDPANYNTDNEAGSDPDERSDDKGPEPEGVAVGVLDGRPYAFLGLERQGGIVAYDLAHRPGRAGFAGYLNTREADLGPEGIAFVEAPDSPDGRALLLVTNEISGTLAVLAVTP